jgi:protein involved in polysaccharide export with SLBB domain
VGAVTAQGRTTTELGTDISRRISLISRDVPQVNVTVVEAVRRRNFVLGAVLLPGSYSFAKAPSVWEAISSAGGPADDADLTAVQIISEGQLTPQVVDVAAAVRSGDLTSLPRLRPGDTVRVQRATGSKGATGDVIYVFGAVASPGPQPLSDASDLVRAIIRSNPAPEANLKKVEIVRRSGARVVSMKVNMTDYVGKAFIPGNPQLLPGDTVYLPRRGGNTDYLRIIGGLLGVATTIAVLTNN